MRWMNLEPTMQSEISQKEKDRYCALMHVWNLEREYWWTCFQGSNGDADRESRLVDTVGEGEGEMSWE